MRKEYTHSSLQRLLTEIDHVEDGLLGQESQVQNATSVIVSILASCFFGLLRLFRQYRASVSALVRVLKKRIVDAFERVSVVDTRYAGLAENHRVEKLEPVKKYLEALAQTITPGSGAFGGLQIRMRFAMLSKDLPYVNPAFAGGGNPELNSNSQYGGDQGAPVSDPSKYYEFVRRYFPNMTDKEIDEFLSQMNHNGCAYISLINTLIKRYAGREEEFRRTFGFDLREPDGTYDYERLFIDYFCTTGGSSRNGMTDDQMVNTWRDYLSQKGVNVNTERVEGVTPENWNQMRNGGDIILTMSPLRMRNEQGKLVDDRNGGHAMTITGVTDDGLFVVSSWGKKYYVDPGDFNDANRMRLDFVRVTY